MPNYWLGIMAIVLAAALALWIALVFRADAHKPGPPQASEPHREVMGGSFAAAQGGRQLMPDPGAPLVPEQGGSPAAEREAARAAEEV